MSSRSAGTAQQRYGTDNFQRDEGHDSQEQVTQVGHNESIHNQFVSQHSEHESENAMRVADEHAHLTAIIKQQPHVHHTQCNRQVVRASGAHQFANEHLHAHATSRSRYQGAIRQRSMSPTACPFGHQQNHGSQWAGLRQSAVTQQTVGFQKQCCTRTGGTLEHKHCCVCVRAVEHHTMKKEEERKKRIVEKQRTKRENFSYHISKEQLAQASAANAGFHEQVDECGFVHLNEESQKVLSQKVVEHTYRLYGNSLLYAKDVPTFLVQNSDSLRKLDSKNEKWLRFEIQYSTECEEKSDLSSSRSHDKGHKHAHPDCLNLSLYDQSDPSNLYLATIDHCKFEKLMNKQNLVIEQFSQLAGHIQLLLDSCIINLPTEPHAATCEHRSPTLNCDHHAQCCDRNFICAINPYVKHQKCGLKEQSGMNVNIFQSNEFRNLLHLSIFFRKANDQEARAWLARKHMISWGIINELGLNIEELDEEVNLGQVAYSELKETLLCEQQIHIQQLDKVTLEFNERIAQMESDHRAEIDDLVTEHQTEVQTMTEEHSKQINTLTVKLEKTQELHQEQVNLCINTKQQLELANQKIVDQRVHLEKTTKELTEKKEKLESTMSNFNGKDKESVQLHTEKQDLLKQLEMLRAENQRLTSQVDDLSTSKINHELTIQKLQTDVSKLTEQKTKTEQAVQALEGTVQVKKSHKEQLKNEKKDLFKQITELQSVIKERDEHIEVLKQETKETHHSLLNEQKVVSEQAQQIEGLKDKLEETMDTLIQNSETIDYLNQNLMEAQKFSFRALLSNKQPTYTASRYDQQMTTRDRSPQIRAMEQTATQYAEVAVQKHTCNRVQHEEQQTAKMEKLQELYEAQVSLCANTKQQLQLAHTKITELRNQIEHLNVELVEKTTIIEEKEVSVQVHTSNELTRLSEEVMELTNVKKTYEVECQRLQSEIVTLQTAKARFEAKVTSLEISLNEQKTEKIQLTNFRKELQVQNKEFEQVIKERDAEIENLRQRIEESLSAQAGDKQVMEDQATQISELKIKLQEALEMLQKNTETIEILKTNFAEVQKTSFRSNLAVKHQAIENSLQVYRQVKQEKMEESTGFQKSFSRSPHHYASSSRSPERIVEKQRWRGNMILNANSFSNVRHVTDQRYDSHSRNFAEQWTTSYGEHQSSAKHTRQVLETVDASLDARLKAVRQNYAQSSQEIEGKYLVESQQTTKHQYNQQQAVEVSQVAQPTYSSFMQVARVTSDHQSDSQQNESREYQANLKMTNKYAERFGLNESDQKQSFRHDHHHMASFGADKQAMTRCEHSSVQVSPYDHRQSKQVTDRSREQQDHYCVQRSYHKVEEKASHHKGAKQFREEPVDYHCCYE